MCIMHFELGAVRLYLSVPSAQAVDFRPGDLELIPAGKRVPLDGRDPNKKLKFGVPWSLFTGGMKLGTPPPRTQNVWVSKS